MKIYYTFSETPVGTVLFTTDGEALTAMYWKVFARAPQPQPYWSERAHHPLFLQAQKQLSEYFAGTRTTFDLPYRAAGTPFQESVWRELEKIPYGTTRSYQQIAQLVGRPNAVRAVGTAVGNNPISIFIPCHRVLTSSGKLGGYAGGLPSKLALLNREGITITAG